MQLSLWGKTVKKLTETGTRIRGSSLPEKGGPQTRKCQAKVKSDPRKGDDPMERKAESDSGPRRGKRKLGQWSASQQTQNEKTIAKGGKKKKGSRRQTNDGETVIPSKRQYQIRPNKASPMMEKIGAGSRPPKHQNSKSN